MRDRAPQDWQHELALRSAGQRSLEAVPPRHNAWLPRARRLLVATVALGLMSAGILLWFDPTKSFAFQGGLLLATVAANQALGAISRHFFPTEEPAYEADPATVDETIAWELRQLSIELRWFLGRPPDRATYNRWVEVAARRLRVLAPEAAARWAGSGPPPDHMMGNVSAVELEARRKLLIGLHRELVPSATLADPLAHDGAAV